MSFRKLWQAWDRFLTEPISPVPISIYRILFGLLVVIDILLMLPELDVFFTEKGILPMKYAQYYLGGSRINVLEWLPNTPGWMHLFFGCFLISAICLTLGLATRIVSLLVFIGLVTVSHRNPLILNGSDTFMRSAAFCLIFAPAGRALSLDRWLRLRMGWEKPGEPRPAAPFAQRLIQMQVSIAYISTVVWKLQGPLWVNGTAVYYAAHLREFSRFPMPYMFDHLWTIQLVTWGTLIVELALGTLIWFREFRYWVMLAGVMLHLGLDYSMNIPLFQWTMITTYVCFADPNDVVRVVKRIGAKFSRSSDSSQTPTEEPVLASATHR